MCGEHLVSWKPPVLSAGSSPHVRGAPNEERGYARPRGIIPACAGSTGTRKRQGVVCRDHPRMCGEHSDKAKGQFAFEGSSPHVRGAHLDGIVVELVLGIIPACAGSTKSA